MRGTHIHSKSDEKIAIIGAGIALAIRLAHKSYAILVFD